MPSWWQHRCGLELWSGGVPVGDPNVPLDNTDSCRDVHRTRNQRLPAGRVL